LKVSYAQVAGRYRWRLSGGTCETVPFASYFIDNRRLYEPGSSRAVRGRSTDVSGLRYQVKDVARAIAFYTHQLGFKLDQLHLPAFGQVSIDGLKLVLSGPGASGSRPMPDGRSQEPAGWNRILLQVTNLPDRIEALKKAGLRFRNELEVGPGGRQIQLEDPDGNPIELFEPAR
jgi:glyoxylase I family protein